MSRGIGGIIALKAVLIIPLLSLFWDESSHLIVVSFPEDLVYGFLGYDTVDRSFLEYLVVVAGGWFKDIFPYAWDQSSHKVSIGGGVSKRVSGFGSQLLEVLNVLINEGPSHFDAF